MLHFIDHYLSLSRLNYLKITVILVVIKIGSIFTRSAPILSKKVSKCTIFAVDEDSDTILQIYVSIYMTNVVVYSPRLKLLGMHHFYKPITFITTGLQSEGLISEL